MSTLSLLTLLLLLCSVALPTLSFDPSKPYPHLTAETFTTLKTSPIERLVLFYYSSTPSSATALSILNTVARRLRSRFPNFAFQHCDGDLQVNKGEFASAGFAQPGEWFFTSTPTEGISQWPLHAPAVVVHSAWKGCGSQSLSLPVVVQ